MRLRARGLRSPRTAIERATKQLYYPGCVRSLGSLCSVMDLTEQRSGMGRLRAPMRPFLLNTGCMTGRRVEDGIGALASGRHLQELFSAPSNDAGT